MPRSNQIFYTTNDGNTISVKSYWPQPILNEYDKEKDLGVMVFEEPLTEIPGISGNPFFHDQLNLLTLKLPNTITKFGRGALWGCRNLHSINFIDLVNLDTLEREWMVGTIFAQIDLRNSKLTNLMDMSLASNSNLSNIDYLLLPQTIRSMERRVFIKEDGYLTRVNTLMIPFIGNLVDIEDVVLENLIINKFDGVADLVDFNTDCIIWVPDEWYDKYIEYYTNNDDFKNWQDIINRLRKYSEGVPQFPYN